MLADSDGLTLCQAVHLWKFLAPLGAQEMQIFICLSVCLFGDKCSRAHNIHLSLPGQSQDSLRLVSGQSQVSLRSVSGQSKVSLRSVSGQSQVSLRSVSGQSQVSLRS